MGNNIPIRRGRQLDYMREAGHLAAEILRLTAAEIRPGVTTAEIDAAAADLIADRGCTSAFLGYRGFPGNICISMNEEVVHGIGGPRVIQPGDVAKIDVGIFHKGWVGDNARSVPVGAISEENERLLFATEEALDAAIAHACHGERLADLCAAVETVSEQFGFTVVRQFVGHGVGRRLHEEPQVPNHWNRAEMGSGPRLKEGMILAIEPMVNAGTEEVKILGDDWTVVTADAALSAHFEHTVLVTKDGPEVLTPRERTITRSFETPVDESTIAW